MFDNIPLISATISRMDWLAHRQQILSQNIANVDTPRYKAKDLDPDAFNRIIREGVSPKLELFATNISHYSSLYGGSTQWAEKQRDFFEATLSENTVNMEENLIKMNQNASDYSLASNVYRKMHGLIAIAVGK